MSATVGIIGGDGREIEQLVRSVGLRPSAIQQDTLTSATRAVAPVPDVVLLDVRDDRNVLAAVPSLKRRYPQVAVAIVAKAFEPELMLEAMRAGVSEVVVEPLSVDALRTSLDRLVVPKASVSHNAVVAVIGAKGGVGATTVAVNLAEAVARANGEALLIDLHLNIGDAAVFLGVEPRFTVVEALENTHRLDAAFLKGLLIRMKSGLDFLGASTRIVQGSVDPHRVRTLLEFASTYSSCVVLDVPRQDFALLESLDSATSIFVVVNQELPTVRAAQSLVRSLQQRYGERVGVIVNRSDKNSEISLDDIAKTVTVPIRHVLPNDYRQATSAANKGQPVAASAIGKLAESFHTLAKSFAAGSTAKKASGSSGDDSNRLFGWLSSKK